MCSINKFCIAITIALLPVCFVFAENNTIDNYPTYQDGVLTIPRVDTPDQAGKYLDGTFVHIGQDIWELQEFKTANEHPSGTAPIDKVELIVVDSFPVQVFLNVQGALSNCGNLGPINQRLIGHRFEVTVHTEFPDEPLGTYLCLAVMDPFEKYIQLSVYGLSAGNYEYSINGGMYTGTFTLTKDNRFALTHPGLVSSPEFDTVTHPEILHP